MDGESGIVIFEFSVIYGAKIWSDACITKKRGGTIGVQPEFYE